MKGNILWIGLILLCFVLGGFDVSLAAGKPNVTRHDVKFMENAVNMHIEWQSANPVTSVKISLPGLAKEIPVDPYDNRRNPDGYSGEVDVDLPVPGMTGQSFNYVLQLQDDLRIKSEPVNGQVKLPSGQMPGGVYPAVATPGIVAVPTSTPAWQSPGGQQPGQAAPWSGSSTLQQPGAVSSGMPSQTSPSMGAPQGAQPIMQPSAPGSQEPLPGNGLGR